MGSCVRWRGKTEASLAKDLAKVYCSAEPFVKSASVRPSGTGNGCLNPALESEGLQFSALLVALGIEIGWVDVADADVESVGPRRVVFTSSVG